LRLLSSEIAAVIIKVTQAHRQRRYLFAPFLL